MVIRKSGPPTPAPDWFMVAFRAMPLLDQQVLLLAQGGYSYSQIADAMGVPAGDVMTQANLAMNALRVPEPRSGC